MTLRLRYTFVNMAFPRRSWTKIVDVDILPFCHSSLNEWDCQPVWSPLVLLADAGGFRACPTRDTQPGGTVCLADALGAWPSSASPWPLILLRVFGSYWTQRPSFDATRRRCLL